MDGETSRITPPPSCSDHSQNTQPHPQQPLTTDILHIMTTAATNINTDVDVDVKSSDHDDNASAIAMNGTTTTTTTNSMPAQSETSENTNVNLTTTPSIENTTSTPITGDNSSSVVANTNTTTTTTTTATITASTSTSTSLPAMTMPSSVALPAAAAMATMNPLLMSAMIPGLTAPPGMLPSFAHAAYGAMPGMPFGMSMNAPAMLPFLNFGTPISTASANKTLTGKRCGDWQSYITAAGKTYYHNAAAKTTTWTKPAEWTENTPATTAVMNLTTTPMQSVAAANVSGTPGTDPEHVQKTATVEKKETGTSLELETTTSSTACLGTNATKELAVVTDTVAKRSFGVTQKSRYKNREQRTAAFRALLSDKRVCVEWPWKQVLPKIVSDRRYNALTKLDDKKRELVAWQRDEKIRIQNEEREQKQKLKSDFFALLEEFCADIVRKDWRKARHFVEDDARFCAVQRKHRREDWFEEWQKVAYKEYKKQRKKQRETALLQFEQKLRELKLVKLGVPWSDVVLGTIREQLAMKEDAMVEDIGGERALAKIYGQIEEELRVEQRRSADKEKSEKKKKLKNERAQFAELVSELIENSCVHARCHVDDAMVVKLLEADARYRNMKASQPQKLADIFSEKMEKLRSDLSDDKKIFRQFLKHSANGNSTLQELLKVKEHDSLDRVLGKFREHGAGGGGTLAKLSERNLKLLLLEYMHKKPSSKSVVKNDKKRSRTSECEHEELVENTAEPRQKRLKIDATCKIASSAAEEPDEGEIEELEEGELSEMDEDVNVENDTPKLVVTEVSVAVVGQGHSNQSRSKSQSRSRSKTRETKTRARAQVRDRSGSRSSNLSGTSERSVVSAVCDPLMQSKHAHAHGRHHRHAHRHQRGGPDDEKPQKRVGDILYGIGSDLDEDDLYYRGEIKNADAQPDELPAEEDASAMPPHSHARHFDRDEKRSALRPQQLPMSVPQVQHERNREREHTLRHNHRDRRRRSMADNGGNVKGHGHWRHHRDRERVAHAGGHNNNHHPQQHRQHEDLDYNFNHNYTHDAEINADSYNLDDNDTQ